MAFCCLSLAFSFFSCSVSFLICSVSLLICSDSCLSSLVRCSISRTGRQFSIDKKDRKGDSDASDAPLLLEGDDPARECDVVIGGEQRDEADDNPGQDLNDALAVEPRKPARRRRLSSW